MAHLEEVQETPHETSNTLEANTPREDGIRCLRIATVVVCIVNLAYVVATAVLIGKVKGWLYSIHCFILSLLIMLSCVRTVRAQADSSTVKHGEKAVKAETKLIIKMACSSSCSALGLVLTTTFTLLTRQAYYHPSPHFESKWVLFSLQAGIIPLLGGILVMYECRIIGLYKDRYILLIAILDFADIWDMASILSQHKPPYLKEESPLEIAVQFFCSTSLFNVFSLLIFKNIIQEFIKSKCKTLVQEASEKDDAHREEAQNVVNCICSQTAKTVSQLYQNIPFLIIRILVLVNHGFLDFDFLAKNVISVILFFLDCCACCRQDDDSDE